MKILVKTFSKIRFKFMQICLIENFQDFTILYLD